MRREQSTRCVPGQLRAMYSSVSENTCYAAISYSRCARLAADASCDVFLRRCALASV